MAEPDDMTQRVHALEKENVALRKQVDQLRTENRRWARLAGTDLLTGLPNKISFLRIHVPQNLRKAMQAGQSVGFMLLSADDLGPINEKHGRAAGDDVLKGLGAFLKSMLGPIDSLGHIDGSHFSVVSVPTDLDALRGRANMLRARVRAHDFSCVDTTVNITLSAGIAAVTPTVDMDDKKLIDVIFQHLNHALYTAKTSGGNQVQAVGDPLTDSFTGKEASL